MKNTINRDIYRLLGSKNLTKRISGSLEIKEKNNNEVVQSTYNHIERVWRYLWRMSSAIFILTVIFFFLLLFGPANQGEDINSVAMHKEPPVLCSNKG